MTSEGFSIPLTLTLSPRGERIIPLPTPALWEGRVRERNELEKKQTIFSLEE